MGLGSGFPYQVREGCDLFKIALFYSKSDNKEEETSINET